MVERGAHKHYRSRMVLSQAIQNDTRRLEAFEDKYMDAFSAMRHEVDRLRRKLLRREKNIVSLKNEYDKKF